MIKNNTPGISRHRSGNSVWEENFNGATARDVVALAAAQSFTLHSFTPHPQSVSRMSAAPATDSH